MIGTDDLCRTCGGPLEILDSDAKTLQVACLECGDNYVIERQSPSEAGGNT